MNCKIVYNNKMETNNGNSCNSCVGLSGIALKNCMNSCLKSPEKKKVFNNVSNTNNTFKQNGTSVKGCHTMCKS